MGRKKALRIKEIQKFPNVFGIESSSKNKNGWNKTIFKNLNPIVLELGCGKGEYVIELAKQFPEKNFIGVDRKADRIWVGATNAIQEKLANVLFIKSNIRLIDLLFGEEEVSEIWIIFPDPHLKKPSQRLTNPSFMYNYNKILKPNSLLHLKTDEERLYGYTLATLENERHHIMFSTSDLYKSKLKNNPTTSIKTTYEKKHIAQGDKICYIAFQLNY